MVSLQPRPGGFTEPAVLKVLFHAGFVLGAGLWVFWSLKRESLVVARDANLSFVDMLTHSTVSAFAFALYSMAMGPHFALVQDQFGIPNVMPVLVMAVFPMVVALLGDTYVRKPVGAGSISEEPLLESQ